MAILKQQASLLGLLLIAIAYSSIITIEARECNTCSPPVTQRTKAILTLNSFEKGGGGGGPSECDGKFHSDKTLIVALSTGWYNKGKRCFDLITIHGNGRSVKAKVVDECDSTAGCQNDIVDASEAVWKALHVPKEQQGYMPVTWSD